MFGSPFGDDSLFGVGQLMRQMDSMMNQMMQDPFQMISNQGRQQQQAVMPFGGMMGFPSLHDPFGMSPMGPVGPMGQMFQGFSQSGFGMGPMYSSSSVMTMSTGPDGQPQVYQASTSTRTGPGGLREVHRSVSDSRSGVRKMAIGRHLGERGHVREKEQNYYTGEQEEREDFINIEEEEAPEFNEEWNRRANVMSHSPRRIQRPRIQHHPHESGTRMLAITDGADANPARSRHSTHHPRGGPDRNARRRDGHRSSKSRHETH